jgi:hypothetical protein
MFDEAALALEEINSVDKTRDEVAGRPRQHLHGGREMGHGRSGGKSPRQKSSLRIPAGGSTWPMRLAAARVIKSAEAILLRAREKVHC